MLEALLQFVLKRLPKSLKELWDKYENVWRYCYYGAWTTLLSMLTKWLGKYLFGLAGYSIADQAIPNGINTAVSWIICATFAFYVNKKYVFHSMTTDRGDLKHEILTFYGARGFSFFLELALMELPVLFHWGDIGYYVMIVLSQFIVLAANYLFSKLVVFRKGAGKAQQEETAQQPDTAE